MEEFRWMINESIRIGLERNLTSQNSFNSNMYHYLSDSTKFLKMYVSRAIMVSKSKLRDFRRTRKMNPQAKIPYYKKSYLIVDKPSYKIIGTTLLIGVKPRQPYVGIPLNPYTMQRISESGIKIGTITVTPDSISISITKDVKPIKPIEFVGIDTNLNNISAIHSDGKVDIFLDVAKITKIKERYRIVKSHFKRNDARIRREIFQKYGKKQQHKTKQILHNVSKKLITTKKRLIIENLTGMRKLYQKGNCQGKKYRSMLNGWSFYELRRQLEYKSKWHNGISVIKIKPNMTSSRCSICGAKIIPEENRQIRCPICGHTEDRDINAARNILYKGTQTVQLRGLRLGPDAPQSEAVKQSKDAEQIVLNATYCVGCMEP